LADAEFLARLGMTVDDLSEASGDPQWSCQLANLIAARRIDAEFATPTIRRIEAGIQRAGGRTLASLATRVRRGVQPEAYAEDGSVLVLKSKDVNYPDMNLAGCERTDGDEWPVVLRGGELVLNSTGEGTLGRSGVVPPRGDDDDTLIPAVDLYVLDVDQKVALPEYVAVFLNSVIGRRLTSSIQTGSSGQQHIYPSHFAQLPILVPTKRGGTPDLEWQRNLVALSQGRVTALTAARKLADELDAFFIDVIGVPVDLGTVPV
jgi:hypothetical protein